MLLQTQQEQSGCRLGSQQYSFDFIVPSGAVYCDEAALHQHSKHSLATRQVQSTQGPLQQAGNPQHLEERAQSSAQSPPDTSASTV
ncbi:hypothetical protein CBOM_07408 [Ceraceosorus bombacis]|uniref:Uncharacterized protein n=1 Tax=Ceraceosorus bombacis TaxID=401625 RepID=A0A0P1BBP1_9BASI|nr:hypothetical protein CBOM_07408 [Ceraceosorus bombacis]